jgi:RNA polymerase sigma-70 factor (ECF subfamily)
MGADGRDHPFHGEGAPDRSFAEFIRLVRAGDEQAAIDLFERYEPAIRRAVRVRLRDPRLRRLVESVEIWQSVFASLLVRTAVGRHDLESPDSLIRLLAAMARNKVVCQANHEHAAGHDQRPIVDFAVPADDPRGGSGYSRQFAVRELLQEARRRVTAQERLLLDRCDQGLEWTDIAAELRDSPDALRGRLAGAVIRISSELGLDEWPDE